MKNGKYRKAATFSLSGCPLREEKSFSQRAFSIYTDIRKLQDKAKTSYRRIYRLHLMTLLSVQIKKYGGEVLAVTNGRQALRLVLMEKNARYVPVRE